MAIVTDQHTVTTSATRINTAGARRCAFRVDGDVLIKGASDETDGLPWGPIDGVANFDMLHGSAIWVAAVTGTVTVDVLNQT